MQEEDGWDEMLAFNEQAGNTIPRQAVAVGGAEQGRCFQWAGGLEQVEQRLSQQGAGRASTCPRLAWWETERRSLRAHARAVARPLRLPLAQHCKVLEPGFDGWWAAGGVWCVRMVRFVWSELSK